jgi:hypothetical protein
MKSMLDSVGINDIRFSPAWIKFTGFETFWNECDDDVKMYYDGAVYTGSATQFLTIINIPGTWYGHKFRCSINGGQQYGKVYTIKFRNEWLGLAGNDWLNPANWSCGRVPDENTDVIVNSGTVHLNNNAVIRSLKTQQGVTIIVSPGKSLTITH